MTSIAASVKTFWMDPAPLKSNRKSVLKRIAISAVGLFVVAVLTAFYIIVNALPSPQEFAGLLPSQKSSELAPKPIVTATATPGLPSVANTASLKRDSESLADPINNEVVKQEKNDADFEGLQKMIQEDVADVRVCNNLGTSQYFKVEANQRMKSFEKIFTDEARNDSVVEAFRLPIRTILQDRSVTELLGEISKFESKGLAKEDRKSFLEKAGFYSRAALTMGHLYGRKQEFEALGNHSMHLAVIAKIAALRPELARDPKIRGFCDQIQEALIEGREVDIAEERQEILKAIEYSGLSASDLDFDPDQFIKFRIQSSKDSFEISLSDKNAPSATN